MSQYSSLIVSQWIRGALEPCDSVSQSNYFRKKFIKYSSIILPIYDYTGIGISVFLLFCLTATLITVPLHAQNFEMLLKELSGSDADQLESETADQQKKDKSRPLSSTEIISPSEEDELAPEKNIVTNGVTLQGLDKPTARVFIIDAAIGQTIEFGTLKIVVQHCEKAPLEDRTESMAFLTITEAKPKSPPQKLFSGWMFSSSPALSSLDHPMYDVWIKECKTLDLGNSKKTKP